MGGMGRLRGEIDVDAMCTQVKTLEILNDS